MPNTVIIEAGQASRDYWRNLWRQRELLYFLAWRDLLVRYKQTVVGATWVLIRPILTLLIFSVVFGKWAALPSGGLPYPLLVFSGMLPWFFFAQAVSDCSNSLLSNSALVGKIYFPRLIVPLTSLLVCAVDYVVSCLLIIFLDRLDAGLAYSDVASADLVGRRSRARYWLVGSSANRQVP